MRKKEKKKKTFWILSINHSDLDYFIEYSIYVQWIRISSHFRTKTKPVVFECIRWICLFFSFVSFFFFSSIHSPFYGFHLIILWFLAHIHSFIHSQHLKLREMKIGKRFTVCFVFRFSGLFFFFLNIHECYWMLTASTRCSK